jgi:hypothetical protein
MEPEGSLPFSQNPAILPSPEPAESSSLLVYVKSPSFVPNSYLHHSGLCSHLIGHLVTSAVVSVLLSNLRITEPTWFQIYSSSAHCFV